MMLSAAATSTNHLLRRHVSRRLVMQRDFRGSVAASSSRSHGLTMSSRSSSSFPAYVSSGKTAAAIALLTTATVIHYYQHDVLLLRPQRTSLDSSSQRRISRSDVLMVGAPIRERATGILFPQLCNGYTLVGCGVRMKWKVIKVYAVGTYVDPIAMSAIKARSSDKIEDALRNPMYPRTIRIVMNRGLAVDKYTTAIVEALEPRMNGQDLETLDEFRALNPPVDLVEGAEIQMTVRGDTLLYRNAVGGVGAIHSAVFTRALCDVYYGDDPVSPTHKQAVLEGIPKTIGTVNVA